MVKKRHPKQENRKAPTYIRPVVIAKSRPHADRNHQTTEPHEEHCEKEVAMVVVAYALIEPC